MRGGRCLRLAVLIGIAALLAHGAFAAKILHMNLHEMYQRADTVVRGTVVAAIEGGVEAGGGAIPTLTYRIKVDERFAGVTRRVGGVEIVEVTVLGPTKTIEVGGRRFLSNLPAMPRLEVGRRYLLLVSARSEVGLGATIGLGQGCFLIEGKPGQETAVNEIDNLGLFRDLEVDGVSARGALPYELIAAQLRSFAEQQ